MLVDECDPAVGTIYGVHDNPNFVVTNTEYYPAFLCALVRRVLDLDHAFGDRIAFLTTWAFYMEGKRCFEGNRTLVTNDNVEKPILNGLRLLGRLADTRLGVESSRRRDRLEDDGPAEEAEVDALAAGSPGRVTVLVWHRADAWWAEGCARVSLALARGCPSRAPWWCATCASTATTPTPTRSGNARGGRTTRRPPSWRVCTRVGVWPCSQRPPGRRSGPGNRSTWSSRSRCSVCPSSRSPRPIPGSGRRPACSWPSSGPHEAVRASDGSW